jgi:hypothetical protein
MEAERTTIPGPARWSASVSVGSGTGSESLMLGGNFLCDLIDKLSKM